MTTLSRVDVDQVTVVPIAQEHIHGFHVVLDSVCRERRYLAFLEAPTPAQCEAFVREHIQRQTTQFVAIAGEQVIGWCDVVPNTRPVSAHSGVLGIGVARAHRGKGVGSALMQAALQGAREFGLTRVELTVREHNTNAIRLYERFGFTVEGLARNAVLVDGEYENLVSMAVLFDAVT